MALAQMMKNTEKEFPCVQCGSYNTSIVREDTENPRLKCNGCSFMFDGKDSLDASRVGAIKPSSKESLADASEPETEELVLNLRDQEQNRVVEFATAYHTIPQNPAYVFLTKNRRKQELVTKRDFKKVAVRWSQEGSFDIYELKKIKFNVKVDIL